MFHHDDNVYAIVDISDDMDDDGSQTVTLEKSIRSAVFDGNGSAMDGSGRLLKSSGTKSLHLSNILA